MSRILIILLFFLVALNLVIADNTFPVSWTKLEYHQGGELVITKPTPVDSTIVTYFIKPNWTQESNVFYVWKGIPKGNSKGFAIGSSYIISAVPHEKNLLVTWKENNRLYVAHVDSNFTMLSITEIYGNWSPFTPFETEWIGKAGKNSYLLIVNKNLFLCSIENNLAVRAYPVSADVLRAAPVNYSGRAEKSYIYSYLKTQEGNGIIFFVKENSEEKFAARIPIPDEVYMYSFGDKVAVVMSSKAYPNSLVQIIDSERGVMSEFWLEAPSDRIKFKVDGQNNNVYYLKNNITGYSLVVNDYTDLKKPASLTVTNIPMEMIEPMGFWVEAGGVYVMFRNGLVSFDFDGAIKSADFYPFGEYFGKQPKLYVQGEYAVISSPTSSIILKEEQYDFWIFNRFVKNFGEIIFPTILIIISLILLQLYRKKKRLLDAVLNLPSSGVVFFIDQHARLTSANSSGKKLLGITDSVPMRKLFPFYCELEHTKPIQELVEKAIANKDSILQKINVVKSNDVNEWYCTVIPFFNMTGRFKGIVLTGVDITEELEKKRLSNWAQLAHDMQTNLSTIRLNAEQLEADSSRSNFERRKKIIHQVGLLIQRVRDIVTVGRSDSVHREVVNSYDICNDVRMEFDEAVFPNVEFEVNAEHFNVSCDKPKIVRALRNAVENGIRSMGGRQGKIFISNRFDTRNAYFIVRDTGVGMDEVTKAKMLTPYFTTSKKTGGAGIGTMIMQHVMELHGGSITISSEKGKGTELVFNIPLFAHSKTIKTSSHKSSSKKGE